MGQELIEQKVVVNPSEASTLRVEPSHESAGSGDNKEPEGVSAEKSRLRQLIQQEQRRQACATSETTRPRGLSSFAVYQDPVIYESYLRGEAERNGIKLRHKRSLWHTLNGAGVTVTVGESGRKYLGAPVLEPIKEIYYTGWSLLAKVHELTHVEQRLINPERWGASLSQIEIEASERALRAGGWRCLLYPISSLNQIINLARFRILGF